MKYLLIIFIVFMTILWGQKPLQFGVATIISPDVSQNTYRSLADYIAHQMNREVHFIFSKNYEQLNTLINNGEIDVGFICSGSLPYIEPSAIRQLLVPVVEDKTTYNSFIIVPKNSSYKTILDLKGKRFAFTDPLSNTGHLYPKYYLAKQGMKSEHFFSDIFFTKSHDRSIFLINNGIVDGAGVDHLVYNFMKIHQPEMVQHIRVIHTSPDIASPPFLISNRLNKDDANKMIEVFLNLHLDPKSGQIIHSLRIDKVIKTTVEDYKIIFDMKEFMDEHPNF